MNSVELKHHIASAEMYLQEGNMFAAEHGFNIVLESDADNKDALVGLAHIAHANGHDTTDMANKLLELYGDEPPVVAVCGTLLDDRELIARSYNMNCKDANVAIAYAKILISEHRSVDASIVLKEIGTGDNLELKLAVAELLVECSEIETSCKLLETILKERPDSWIAYCHALPLFDHAKNDTCNADTVKAIIARLSTPKDKLPMLTNGLGRLLDKRGDVEGAWKAYDASNAIVKPLRTNYPDYRAIEERYEKTFTADFFEELPKASDSPMIFVFGMPRSGTTLTEQILGKHSDITALGELMAVPKSGNIFGELWQQGSDDVPANPDELAEQYLKEHVRSFDTKYAVDKMPANFKFIPLIYAMFPNAKFVYCKRDALDNCFSCLTTLFANRHDYSFDQVELGKEYNHHLWLMHKWRELLPRGTIHQVNYEDMVADQEGTTRKLLDYIGVDYEKDCKDFHTLKRNVRTASLAQVVKPMYTTSVSRAEPYRKYLTDLIEVLNANSEI